MAGTFHRLSIYLLAIALAVAPLRGALALVAVPATAAAHDCPHLQYDAHPWQHTADGSGTQDGGHGCSRDCGGACCGNACTCAQAAPGISASLRSASFTPEATRHTAVFPGFSQRSLPPPFRPPVSCPI
jgi:hypothetical protein